jgi:hypothetical protein
MPFNVGGNIWNGAMADVHDYKSGILKRGLVVNLDASALESYPGSGTTWYDMGYGNTHNAALHNSPTFNSSGYFNMDGSNDYFTISDDSDWDFDAGDFTIEFVIKNQSGTGEYRIFQLGYDQEAAISIVRHGTGSSNRLLFTVHEHPSPSSNHILNMWGPVFSESSNWHHFIFTRVGLSGIIYENGVPSDSSSFTNGDNGTTIMKQSSTGISIGREGTGTGGIFGGQVALWRIYKGRGFTTIDARHNFNVIRDRFGV